MHETDDDCKVERAHNGVVRVRVLPLAVLVAALIAGCTSGDDDDRSAPAGTTTSATTAPAPSAIDGPSVALDTEQLLSGGLAKAVVVVVLRHVPVPRRGQQGTVVGFHPTADAVEVTVKSPLPRGHALEVCRTDDAGVRRGAQCSTLTKAGATASLVFPGAPAAHVGIELAGTGDDAFTVDEVRVEYRNVDYFLSTTFPPAGDGTGE